jgi:branched-chain amino acid transport system ATP-binding protein
MRNAGQPVARELESAARRQLLAVERISKSFGSVKVADRLSFEVGAGEVLGILGPNGAGKTTLFNLITGDVSADAGRIWFQGHDITHSPPHRRCRAGIGRSYQIARPFAGLTVFENLLVGSMLGGRCTRQQAYDECVDLLRGCGLAAKSNRLAGSLTLLDRKRLELARALATQPRLLLLDEIAGGLTDHEAQQLVEIVIAIRARGIAILWIEHVVHALMAVATRLLVLNAGEKLAEGDPAQVMSSAAVSRAYLGVEA